HDRFLTVCIVDPPPLFHCNTPRCYAASSVLHRRVESAHESGHFYVAKSGHFNLAATTKIVDNSRYVKSKRQPSET
ncbi:hypothetical protein, partial [Burkholderia paludis]